jgi:hypothetical protein
MEAFELGTNAIYDFVNHVPIMLAKFCLEDRCAKTDALRDTYTQKINCAELQMEWVRNTINTLTRTDTQKLIELRIHGSSLATDIESETIESKWREVYNRLDKNQDGVLCKEEFRRFCLLLLVVDSQFFKEKV